MQKITTNDLRQMRGKEGIIFQGCGGDPQEWLDGINDELTKAGVLMDGTKFSDASVFDNKGLSCILFPFDESVHLNMGKFAMWRLATYGAYNGTWLSDYVTNNLGGFAEETATQTGTENKPDCPLIGQDGNIFNLLGIATRTLRKHGMAAEAKEMANRVYASHSYSEALGIFMDYVNVTSVYDDEDHDEDDDLFEDDLSEDEDLDEDQGMGGI